MQICKFFSGMTHTDANKHIAEAIYSAYFHIHAYIHAEIENTNMLTLTKTSVLMLSVSQGRMMLNRMFTDT